MSESIGGIPLRILEEAARQFGKLVPPEAAGHFINAQREVVLGVTALIERNNRPTNAAPRSRRSPSAAARPRRPRRVPVD
jgi:hypothetical protein